MSDQENGQISWPVIGAVMRIVEFANRAGSGHMQIAFQQSPLTAARAATAPPSEQGCAQASFFCLVGVVRHIRRVGFTMHDWILGDGSGSLIACVAIENGANCPCVPMSRQTIENRSKIFSTELRQRCV